eukprot:RCo014904
MTKSGNHQHTHISAMPKYPKRKAQMKTFKWEQEGNQCRLRRGVRTLAPFDVTEKQQTHTDTEEISVRTLCTRTCRTLGMTFPVKKEKKMSVRKNPPPPQHPWLSHSQVLKERIENTKKTHRPLSTHGFPVTRIREKPPFPQYSSHPASSYKGKEERIQKTHHPFSILRKPVSRYKGKVEIIPKKPPLPQYSSNLRFQVKLAHAEKNPIFMLPPILTSHPAAERYRETCRRMPQITRLYVAASASRAASEVTNCTTAVWQGGPSRRELAVVLTSMPVIPPKQANSSYRNSLSTHAGRNRTSNAVPFWARAASPIWAVGYPMFLLLGRESTAPGVAWDRDPPRPEARRW